MTEQTSRLAIVIDSTGAEKNADNLTTALHGLTDWGQKAAASAGKVTKASKEESDALSDLLDRIDPVNAALNKLDKQQQDLAKFRAKGMVDTDTFELYSKRIEDTRNKLTGFSEQLNKTGQSAKQTAFAMRMIPAQMTDIVVGLSTGQSPFMVLMQQGGQLKDMFGGIGPAIKGVGSYVMGLVNPFTLAAAAVGVLGLAYYKGSQEQDEFNKSLTLTGNLAGKTSGQLADIAARAGAAANSTTGVAASALNQLVSSGKVAGDSLESVTTAIVKTSDATGIATDKLVGDFNDIATDPVAAITKLNDQYHFLTLATYNQIKALQDEGNQQEAARVASEAYSSSLIQRSNQINENLDLLESAWDALGKSAKSAWDQMLNVGREKSLEQRLADAQAKVQNSTAGYTRDIWGNVTGLSSDAQSEINILQNVINLQDDLAGAISEGQKAQDKAIKTQQEADRVNQQFLSNADKRNKAIEQQKKFLDAGAISAEQYAKNVTRINEMYKDPKAPKGKAYTEDAGTRMLDNLHQQQQALLAQSQTSDKLGTQQQALIKWEQQLADIKTKQTLTADQKSLLASADLITAQLQQNAAIEKQIANRERLLSIERARADVERTIANRSSQYGVEEFMSSGGMSQYEQQQYQQRLSLEQSYNDKITQLRQQKALATNEMARQEIDEEIQLQQKALATELSNYDAHIERMNETRGSFAAGASRAWQEYLDSAKNASAMSQQLFSSAFSGMEDAVVNFVTTGKASFKDFATSVIADIARIATRQAIAGIGASIFGAVLSAGAGAAAGSGGYTPSASYNNAAANISFNAKGGVYDSPSLSSYSGGVYDSPKLFAFAKGAGVFAEAGPEAIMPLAKSPDGSLGVRAIGGAGAATQTSAPQVNIVIQSDGTTKTDSTAGYESFGKDIGAYVDQRYQKLIARDIRPGGTIWNATKGSR